MKRANAFIFLLVAVALNSAASNATAQIKLGVTAGNLIIEKRQGDVVVEKIPVEGANITEVAPGSIAESMKLQKNDLIRVIVTKEQGKRKIDEIDHLVWVMENSKTPPSELYFVRGGKLLSAVLVEVQETVDVQVASTVTVPDGKGGFRNETITRTVKQTRTVQKPQLKVRTDLDLRDAKPVPSKKK